MTDGWIDLPEWKKNRIFYGLCGHKTIICENLWSIPQRAEIWIVSIRERKNCYFLFICLLLILVCNQNSSYIMYDYNLVVMVFLLNIFFSVVTHRRRVSSSENCRYFPFIRFFAFHFLFCFFAPFSSILSVFVFSSLASQHNIITRHFHCQSITLSLTRTHWVFCYFRTFWIWQSEANRSEFESELFYIVGKSNGFSVFCVASPFNSFSIYWPLKFQIQNPATAHH